MVRKEHSASSHRAYSDAESYPEEDINDVLHKDFQHQDFVATVNSTRISNRWANRRRSLVKRGHKSAQSHNEEDIDYDSRMRQAKKKKEEQERRYIEKRKHNRNLRSRTGEREHYRSRTAERDRKNKSQEREREPDPKRKENERDYKNMYHNKSPIARERIEGNYKMSQRNHTHSPHHNAGCKPISQTHPTNPIVPCIFCESFFISLPGVEKKDTTSTSGHTHGSTPTRITSRNPDDPSSTFSSNRSRGNNYLILTPEEAKLINSKHKKKMEMEYHQRQHSKTSHHTHPYDFANGEKVGEYQSDMETIERQESDGFYRDVELAKRSRNYSDPDGGYYSGYEKYVGQHPPPEEQQVCQCAVM